MVDAITSLKEIVKKKHTHTWHLFAVSSEQMETENLLYASPVILTCCFKVSRDSGVCECVCAQAGPASKGERIWKTFSLYCW